MRKIIFGLLMLFPITAFAGDISYVIMSNTGPYTTWSQTETQPGKGNSYTDNNANTSITRISSGTLDTGATYGVHPEYAWDCRSSDGHYIVGQTLLSGYPDSGGGYWLYTTTTTPCTAIHDIGAITGEPNSQEPELRWDNSGSHPTWLYYRSGMTLNYIDVSDYSTHLVHNFSPAVSGTYIWSGDEGGPSENSRYWAFMVYSGGVSRIITYDKQTDTLIQNISCPDSDLNNVYVSKSGTYFITSAVETSGSAGWYGTWSWNFQTGSPLHQLQQGSVHQCVAYDKQGNEVLVSENDGSSGAYVDYIQFTRMDNGNACPLFYHGNLGWNANSQFLAPGIAHKGWAFLSTYAGTNGYGDNQIFGLELDETHTSTTTASNRIWRVAQLQNLYSGYLQQPNISITEDGTQIYFGSDWKSTSNGGEIYRVNMPTNWYTDLGGSVDTSSPKKFTTSGKFTINGKFTIQ